MRWRLSRGKRMTPMSIGESIGGAQMSREGRRKKKSINKGIKERKEKIQEGTYSSGFTIEAE